MSVVELRIRSKRVPRAVFPSGEVRIWLGEAANRAERRELERARDILRDLAKRGQWDVLHGVRHGSLTWQEVVRVAMETGLDTLHLEISDPGQGEPIAVLMDEWLRSYSNEKTQEAYSTAIRWMVEQLGEETRWTDVGRHDINRLLGVLEDAGLAANTRDGYRIAWSSFWTWALDREESMAEQEGRKPRQVSHPVRKSRPVQTATTRHRFLSEDELERLMEVTLDSVAIQYLTLAYTGMRAGEFISRRPEDVTDTVIRIHPREGWSPKGWPRYDHGVRDIPVHQGRLRAALERYRDLYAGDRTFFVNPRTVGPWNHQSLKKQLQRDCAAAGIVYGRKQSDGITLHTFRHTTASWLAQRDVQLLKIARILGDSLETVATYYAHLLPSDLDRTINLLPGEVSQ